MYAGRRCFDCTMSDRPIMPAFRVGWLMLGLQWHYLKSLLGRCSSFGSRFLAIALVEAIDASGGVDELLLTSEERVASRTNFDVQIALLG